jgi:FixJ family two-component response regulator
MQDNNRVIGVVDGPGMLKGLQRLLRQRAYPPIAFSSAAFKSHAGFEKAVCVVLDINLSDGSGIELGLIYITGMRPPPCAMGDE